MMPLTKNKNDDNLKRINSAQILDRDKTWLYEQYTSFKNSNIANADFKIGIIINDLESINKKITKLKTVNLINEAEALKLAEDLDYRFITMDEANENSIWQPFTKTDSRVTLQTSRFQIQRALIVLTSLSEKMATAETKKERDFILTKVAELIDNLKSKEALESLRNKLILEPEFNPFLEPIPVHKNPEPGFLA